MNTCSMLVFPKEQTAESVETEEGKGGCSVCREMTYRIPQGILAHQGHPLVSVARKLHFRGIRS